MTSTSSSQPLIEPPFRQTNYFWKTKAFDGCVPGEQAQGLVVHAMINGPIHTQGIYRIPLAPLLDSIRRLTGAEDEADRCMQFVRDNLPPEYAAEIGRVGDDDANYIIIYPRNNKPRDFRKSKTNVLTVVELVKVALFSLENEVKPYQTVCGVKVTRSNLSTVRDIANAIREALPMIKIASFADKYSLKQMDDIINRFMEIKKIKEIEEMKSVLRERGFSDDQIKRLTS